MACEVCQHCQEAVSREEGYAIREGFSYHNKCHKCYVCSETNLQNAEVFKGVIFCSNCSKRIFRGCSMVRRMKSGNRAKSKTRNKRREKDINVAQRNTRPIKAVLELARLTASTDTDSKSNLQQETDKEPWILSNTPAMTTEFALQVDKQIHDHNWTNCKTHSTEMGLTTDVTQELLRQMKCPVIEDCKNIMNLSSLKAQEKAEKHSKKDCSDLRIAELGASTEIAHMALRKKSEVPILIKSELPLKCTKSLNMSTLNQESDISDDVTTDCMVSTYRLQKSANLNCLDRRIRSILKMPYKCFKRNILNRSSLITVLMSNEGEKQVLVNRLKTLFHEEVTEHQRRGLRRLYSAVNRRKTPYKLGWLDLMAKVSVTGLSHNRKPKRCQHFKTSHSYRCMRSQVMRLAGPTESELAGFRMKIKKILIPVSFKNILVSNKKIAITMSQACGSELH
ncbi:uncharacterized protein LOC128200244 [Galleria mellonella]|uniref:Uncharacterized protein LOC128200244 n=1 Tax=Galleria mellonella TaxID=7137 RepID=A0ABM3MC28_GALME|nr:uncharacterized protein LOC128200244 [Galleria mellonella]